MKDANETKQLKMLEKADEFALRVYEETKKFPEEEFFGLALQLRMLAVKVPLFILEGMQQSERKGLKEKLNNALSKIAEVKYLLRFSYRLKYLSQPVYGDLDNLQTQIDGMLWRFYNAF